jgi:hypothetical protein
MGKKVSIKTTTVTVTGTPAEVLAANVERNFLALHNKSAVNVLFKFGSNFGGANSEVQRITFFPNGVPSSGAFKLKYGENKTASIPYNAAADSDIQTALQAVEGCSGATVEGNFITGFEVTFLGTQAQTNVLPLEVTDNTLATDDFRADEVQKIVFSATPTAGSYKVKFGTEKTAAIAFDDNASAVQAHLREVTGLGAVTVAALVEEVGFAVTFASSHADAALLEVTDATTLTDETVIANETQEIYVNSEPTAGTFKLRFGAVGFGEDTAALDFDATSAEIQSALRALTNIGSSTTVAGTGFLKAKRVVTNTVNVLENQVYSITTPNHVHEYTPGGVPTSKSAVAAALLALINAVTDDGFTASLGGTSPNQTLILTADVPGVTFTATPSDNLTAVETVTNKRGMVVTFLGSDAAINQPLIIPVEVDLERHGEKLEMAVFPGTEGEAAAVISATVTETVKGVDDLTMVGSVATVLEGLAFANEGTPLEPGARISMSEAVPVDSVWAECDEDTALLEIQEG